jgi:hypothetical protein
VRACYACCSPGLHPFYPPALQLLRPRLAGPVPAALASHPALRLDHWDPWRTQKQLLQLLRGFLGVRAALRPLGTADCSAACPGMPSRHTSREAWRLSCVVRHGILSLMTVPASNF